IAAQRDNDIGIDGINPDAPIWLGRAVGSGQWANSLVEFVDAAVESGQPNAVITINPNLTEVYENGTVGVRYELTDAEWEALAYANKHNILVVVPAGENGEFISALGQTSLSFDNVITVGTAQRINDAASAWQSHGAASNSPSGFALNILADGTNDEISTTTISAGKVAGAVSQVWAANPKLSHREVIDILQNTATDLNEPGWDFETGSGLLNIAAAVHLAKATKSLDVDVPIRWLKFEKSNQPLIGVIDTGFNGSNPDIDYSRVTLGRDHVDGDDNPLFEGDQGNEHGTHVLGIIAATQDNGIGVDGINDQAPLWLGRAVGSGKWAESLREFVDAAKASGQPNAVVNLSFDLTQTNPDGTVTTRYELTPQEREAIEYARQNGVLIVVAAGNDGGTMSALGQASQEFDNLITVGSVDERGKRASYSNLGYGLDLVSRGGTAYNPITSTVGEGTDLKTFLEDNSDEVEEDDEMSVALQSVFEEEFGEFYDPDDPEDDSELPEDWTDQERQAYQEAIKAIDEALDGYEEEALQKVGMEFISDYLNIGVEASEEFLKVFDEDAIDSLIEAEEILGDVLENGEPTLKAGLEFSSLSDLDVDEDEVDEELIAELMGLDFSIDPDLDMGTGEMAGTSVAAAKVTGAVSKVWAANPDLSYKQVKEILKATAVDLGPKGWDKETGYGLVDIAAAVALAKETQPEAYTPKPILSPLTWSGEGTVIAGERPVNAVQYKGKYFQWTSYTVRSGDNLSLIASRLSGLTSSDWSFIYDKNRNVIGSNPSLIYPGQVLQIPIEDPGYLRRREEERKRQEAIRKAEEAARQAEAEARRLEEEARRAEEELRRLEEEARRQAEEEARRRAAQLAAAIAQWTPKVGAFGTPLGSFISNGVAVYRFAQGNLLIQPDGRSAYYNLNKAAYNSLPYQGVRKGLDWLNAIKVGGIGDPLLKIPNIMSPNPKDIFSLESFIGSNLNKSGINLNKFLDSHLLSSNRYWKTLDTLSPIANRLPPKQALKLMGNTSNFFKSKSPNILARTGKLGAKTLDATGNFFKILDTPITKFGGKNAPVVGDVIDLAFTGHDLIYGDEATQRRAQVKLGAMGAGAIIGGAVGALGFGVGAAPAAMGTAFVVGSIVDFAYFGADQLGHGDKVDKFLSDSYSAVGNGINSVKSSISDALKAARDKAATARDKAQKAVQVAKATVKAATAKVVQAKAAYNTFKQQTQQAVSNLVQKSTQVFKASLQQAKQAIAQKVAQAAPRVVKKVAQYAQKAVNTVRNVVNGAKRVVNNVINKGKQLVNNVINKGKQAVQSVKNFASNVVNKAGQAAANVYNRAAQGVKNVKNTLSGAAKRLKFW
ncbi:S8 family serine peptidase, partial [Spirulina subsalsa FACHB-351]|nr:S8 family serine peptidase [Spirulina subsalsa FACHB-351]